MTGTNELRSRRVRELLAALGYTAPGVRDWSEDAACASAAPDLFFPVGGGAQAAAAKRVCAGCPVRESCLAEVMASEDPGMRWGVSGGLSAAERAALFATRRDQQAREVA